MFSFFSKRQWLMFGGCSMMLAGALFYFYWPSNQEKEPEQLPMEVGEHAMRTEDEKVSVPNETTKEEKAPVDVVIDVKGEVISPGVYTMKSNERVLDAIKIAGGMTSEANTTTVNLAELLHDSMVIYVPSIHEEQTNGTIGPNTEKDKEKVLLNQATAQELETVPGIGPSKAAAIIQYREENGKFATVDDLTNVPGIGDKTLENIRDYFIVK